VSRDPVFFQGRPALPANPPKAKIRDARPVLDVGVRLIKLKADPGFAIGWCRETNLHPPQST